MPASSSPIALILFSHGSLLCGAGMTLKAHAERLQKAGGYLAVEIGYLNYSQPTFEDAVVRCIAAGVKNIVVVPYFLVPGKFVTDDLPARLKAAHTKFPNLIMVLGDSINDAPQMAEAILEMAAQAKPPVRWRDDLGIAPLHCIKNPQCPLYGSEPCMAANRA